MNTLSLLSPTVSQESSNVPDMSWLGPAILGTASVVVALVGIVSLILGKRQDRKNAKAAANDSAELAMVTKPIDGWDEIRKARAEASRYYNLFRAFQDAFYTVQDALRHLARMIHESHPDQELPQEVVDALAMKAPADATTPTS